MSPAEVLRKAADVIRERGHCKGHYERHGSVCIFGALNVIETGNALEPPPDITESERWLRKALGGDSVTLFNDAPERTAEEVIAALEKAAALAEASK